MEVAEELGAYFEKVVFDVEFVGIFVKNLESLSVHREIGLEVEFVEQIREISLFVGNNDGQIFGKFKCSRRNRIDVSDRF